MKHDLPRLRLDNPYTLIPNRVRGYLVDRNSKIELNDGRKLNRDYLNGTPGDVTNAALYDISNRYPVVASMRQRKTCCGGRRRKYLPPLGSLRA